MDTVIYWAFSGCQDGKLDWGLWLCALYVLV